MLKLAGAAMIIFACGLAGITVARNYTRRPQQLKAFVSALQMLETHITYASAPLPEAFDTICRRCQNSIAPFFKKTGELLRDKTGYSASEAWDKALLEYIPQTSFTNNDLQIFKNFGSTLGISDRIDQEKHIRLATEQIKMELVKAEEAAVKGSKMWRYMGFLGGLMIVLIIY